VLCNLGAAAVGCWAGYVFGYRVAGVGLAWMTALCAAALCSLWVDAALSKWTR